MKGRARGARIQAVQRGRADGCAEHGTAENEDEYEDDHDFQGGGTGVG